MPEDYELSGDKRCNIGFSSSNVMTASDYKSSLEVNVKANFKGECAVLGLATKISPYKIRKIR